MVFGVLEYTDARVDAIEGNKLSGLFRTAVVDYVDRMDFFPNTGDDAQDMSFDFVARDDDADFWFARNHS